MRFKKPIINRTEDHYPFQLTVNRRVIDTGSIEPLLKKDEAMYREWQNHKHSKKPLSEKDEMIHYLDSPREPDIRVYRTNMQIMLQIHQLKGFENVLAWKKEEAQRDGQRLHQNSGSTERHPSKRTGGADKASNKSNVRKRTAR